MGEQEETVGTIGADGIIIQDIVVTIIVVVPTIMEINMDQRHKNLAI